MFMNLLRLEASVLKLDVHFFDIFCLRATADTLLHVHERKL